MEDFHVLVHDVVTNLLEEIYSLMYFDRHLNSKLQPIFIRIKSEQTLMHPLPHCLFRHLLKPELLRFIYPKFIFNRVNYFPTRICFIRVAFFVIQQILSLLTHILVWQFPEDKTVVFEHPLRFYQKIVDESFKLFIIE